MKSLLAIAIGIIAVLSAAACNGDDEGTPDVCKPNPDPASADVLIIDTPQPGEEVTSPIEVSGQIAAFEATFRITLFDADGSPIADINAMSQEGQVLSPFSEQVAFPSSAVGPACLWVYELSARDGSTINVGQVPLLLLPPP